MGVSDIQRYSYHVLTFCHHDTRHVVKDEMPKVTFLVKNDLKGMHQRCTYDTGRQIPGVPGQSW